MLAGDRRAASPYVRCADGRHGVAAVAAARRMGDAEVAATHAATVGGPNAADERRGGGRGVRHARSDDCTGMVCRHAPLPTTATVPGRISVNVLPPK
jgi:hypothetical protein